jgi:hypothetical protein
MIIDRRKLEVLIRIGCPDEQLLQLIKTGTFTKTGDNLIDDTLECLIDMRDFDNWGGKREGAGRKPKNQDENQVEFQDESHLANQDANHLDLQVVDKDIDIDIDKNNSIKERGTRGKPLKEEENQFNEFWKLYTPVQCSDGKHTDKGSRKTAFEAFKRALKKDSYENIKDGLKRYLEKKAKNNSLTAYVSTFLNQESWKDNENEELILAVDDKKMHPEKSNYQKTMEMVERMKREEWN